MMKEEFEAAISTILKENRADGRGLTISPLKKPLVEILMIDGKTRRKPSPMLKLFYSLVGSWEDAYLSKSILDPTDMENTLKDEYVVEAIDLRRENWSPHPPTEYEDLSRAALFAIDVDQCEETYFWWRNDADEEPMIVDFFGGDASYFKNIRDRLFCYAYSMEELKLDLLEELEAERG